MPSPPEQRYSAETVERVPQEHAEGCGPAVVAMLTGCTYADAAAKLVAQTENPHKGDWNAEGITEVSIDRALINQGYYLQRHYERWYERWPIKPFAPVHYAQVRQASGRAHFVVMRADGVVLDPMRAGEYRLTDWPGVNYIAGAALPAETEGEVARLRAELTACRREYDELWATERERDPAVASLAAAATRFREALSFYANEDNYDGFAPVECRVADDGEDGGCQYDKGAIARSALSRFGPDGKERE